MLTVHDKIHLVFIGTMETLAFLSNICLILAIIFRTPKLLRMYSLFLLCNAIIDLCSAVAAILGTIRVVQNHKDSSMINVFLGPCSLVSEQLCRLSYALHINLINHSTIVLLLSFAFRLYVLDSVTSTRTEPTASHVCLACTLPLLVLIPHTVAYYFEQTTVAPDVITRLELNGYTTSNYSIFESTRGILLNAFVVILSPLVMTTIFFVRRRLLVRIEQAKPTEKELHASVARALTYQMLLPCGVAIGGTFWLCDVTEIWTSEFAERFMMITCSVFPLASPLINFTVIPPYRAILPFNNTNASNVVAPSEADFTSTSHVSNPNMLPNTSPVDDN